CARQRLLRTGPARAGETERQSGLRRARAAHRTSARGAVLGRGAWPVLGPGGTRSHSLARVDVVTAGAAGAVLAPGPHPPPPDRRPRAPPAPLPLAVRDPIGVDG